jgi:hypothetical protein
VNYLAHAYRFLDRPQFVAGTALPDWMNVVDRKNKPRRQLAQPLLADSDPDVAELAAGVVQHHDDDLWFHAQIAFVVLSAQFAVELRQQLPPGGGHQAGFLGHILVELLLDAALIQRNPKLLDRYYQLLDQLNVHRVQSSANRILRTAEDRLVTLIHRFAQERFLADYVTDSGLQYRVAGVMRRVGLPPLPDLAAWLSSARQRVYQSTDQLLPSS